MTDIPEVNMSEVSSPTNSRLVENENQLSYSTDSNISEVDLSGIENPLRSHIIDKELTGNTAKPTNSTNHRLVGVEKGDIDTLNEKNNKQEKEEIKFQWEEEEEDGDTGEEYTEEDRELLLKKINLYYEHFKDELGKVRKPRGLNSASAEELNNFLKKIDGIVSGSCGHDLVKSSYITAISSLEAVSAFTPLKLNGLSNALNSSPYIDKQLKRLEIKYFKSLNAVSQPESALFASTILTALAIHRMNSSLEKDSKRIDLANVKIHDEDIHDLMNENKDL